MLTSDRFSFGCGFIQNKSTFFDKFGLYIHIFVFLFLNLIIAVFKLAVLYTITIFCSNRFEVAFSKGDER